MGTSNRIARAESLRRSGKLTEAWTLYLQLAALAPDDPQLARWIQANEERFARGTRNYSVSAEALIARYEASPSADGAWRIFRSWARAGDWDQALIWGLLGLETHGSSWTWRQGKAEVARAAMIAGAYDQAHSLWVELASPRSPSGRTAMFYQGFSALRAGRLGEAETTLGSVIDGGREWVASAHYWRARIHEARGHLVLAAMDRARATSEDSTGWYALLLQAPSAPSHPWGLRDGSWKGQAVHELPDREAPEAKATPTLARWPATYPVLEGAEGTRSGLHSPQIRADWAQLTWARVGTAPAPAHSSTPFLGDVPHAGFALPDGYVASRWFDPEAAREALVDFAAAHHSIWPELEAAIDLADAGLHAEAARLVGGAYEEWKAARKGGHQGEARSLAMANISRTTAEWRPLFLAVRDHHHVTRFTTGLERKANDDEERRAALRLAHPVVRAPELWQHAQSLDIDPFMMLGLMRQESSYRETARSRVGATGLLQIMPRTGSRMADILGETDFHPDLLLDPSLNLRYGLSYMALLLRRFEGVFPMAVASYNAGPHNVSRWYRPWQGRISMDAFVEQIPYTETRDYVKKVSGNYAAYVALYGPPQAQVSLAARPLGEKPWIVDF